MNNLQYWLEHVADMPERDSRGWYDMESGLRYDASVKYNPVKTTVNKLSAKAQAARGTAKFFGGKALKGTAKQKEWAEKIRAEKLSSMTEDQAEMVCDPAGILTNSKFWIENRTALGKDIGLFIEEQKAALKQYRAAAAKEDREAIKTLAERYNSLTEKWGFVE
jgi:hypothetical protein